MRKTKVIYTDCVSDSLLARYPEERYTIVKIPYIYADRKAEIIKVLDAKDLEKIRAKKPEFKVSHVTAVLKKMNWSVKNELSRKSLKFDPFRYRFEVDYELYVKNVMADCLVLLAFEDSKHSDKNRIDTYVEKDIVEIIDKDLLLGLAEYVKLENEVEEDEMDDDEEGKLRRDMHKYFSYWRKANSTNPAEKSQVRGQEPPACPSIVIELTLAEEFGWTLEYIRSISIKDLKAIQIYQEQRSISEFEGSPEAKNWKLPNNEVVANLTYKQAEEFVQQQEQKRLEAEQQKKEAAEQQAKKEKKEKSKQSLSMAEEHMRRIKKL